MKFFPVLSLCGFNRWQAGEFLEVSESIEEPSSDECLLFFRETVEVQVVS